MVKQEIEYQIQRPVEITAKRMRDGKPEYLIKWESQEDILLETWEPHIHLKKCQSLIHLYEKETRRKDKELRRKKRDERIEK